MTEHNKPQDNVIVPRELLRQILSFVEEGNPGHIADKINVLVKLRAALEQPAVEPVGDGWQLRYVYFQDGEPTMHKAPPAEPVAKAWDEGYRAGIDDERMSEENIGVAGFNAKIEPARNNPYRRKSPPTEPAPVPLLSDDEIVYIRSSAYYENTTQGVIKFARAIEQLVRRKAGL